MTLLTGTLKTDKEAIKKILSAEDIFTFDFIAAGGIQFCVIYADAITDKELLSEQVIQPMRAYTGGKKCADVSLAVPSPELKKNNDVSALCEEILSGNPVLIWEGADEAIVAGTKKVFPRAVAEPPTDVTIKGPREGFIEDLKINTSLVRRRLKTEKLQIETVQVGRLSNTAVALCYLEGTSVESVLKSVKERLSKIDIDYIPDSSYIARFLAERGYSLTKQVGTTEKPDIFCAKIAEGRVGILVDGTPIALTVPYLIMEDFQASEDYFVPPYRATFTRVLRFLALFIAIYLPAFYIAAQLYKLQLFPVKLLLTISGSIRNIPLTPSLEMLLVLLVLEVLNEASIRMPKYVGMALSVVGALVLGETAVSAGFVSTPAIIIIAFSGIGLYTVPNLIEETSVLRLAMLLVAGSIGTYGIMLLTAFILLYLTATESFSKPILEPFSPLIGRDLRDSVIKYNLTSLSERPRSIGSKNRRRFKS